MMRPSALAILVLVAALSGGARPAQAQEAPLSRLYLHTGAAVGYSHYWQIGHADRNVGGATLELPLTAAVRLRRWFAIGGAMALRLHPAHAGRNEISNEKIDAVFGYGGHIGLALVFFAPRVVHGALVVGMGGDATVKVWGGFGAVIAPSLTFDVWSRGRAHLGVDLRFLSGHYTSSSGGYRPLLGAMAGMSFSYR